MRPCAALAAASARRGSTPSRRTRMSATLGRRRCPQHDQPAPGPDRGGQVLGRRRAQQPHRPRRLGLLDGLEQGVRGCFRGPVGILEQHDVPAPGGRSSRGVQHQVPGLLYPVGEPVRADQHEVGVAARAHLATARARPAALRRAEQRGGEGPGGHAAPIFGGPVSSQACAMPPARWSARPLSTSAAAAAACRSSATTGPCPVSSANTSSPAFAWPAPPAGSAASAWPGASAGGPLRRQARLRLAGPCARPASPHLTAPVSGCRLPARPRRPHSRRPRGGLPRPVRPRGPHPPPVRPRGPHPPPVRPRGPHPPPVRPRGPHRPVRPRGSRGSPRARGPGWPGPAR